MIDLTSILVVGAYRAKDIATLFNLPDFEIETQFGPQPIRTADLLNRANQFQSGGSNSIDPDRPTSDSLAAFQAATAIYALGILLGRSATFSNAQLAALFARTSDEMAFLGDGPTSAAAVLAAIAGNPSVYFARVTTTTVAAFRAA